MGSEKFCLRWNDFESNISVAFRELRDDKDFFDVTLACDDRDQIQAHKVILSACSPFFRNVLRRHHHQHPLLYLKGVKFADLQSVLNFMYHGEVNVAQDDLNSFLVVAEDLQVKGLTQGNNSSDKGGGVGPSSAVKQSSKSDSFSNSSSSHSQLQSGSKSTSTSSVKNLMRPSLAGDSKSEPPVKRAKTSFGPSIVSTSSASVSGANNGDDDDDDIQEVVPVKCEPRDISVASSGSAGYADNGGARDDVAAQASAVADPEVSHELVEEGAYDDGAYDDYGDYDASYDGSGGAMGIVDPSMAGPDGNKDPAKSLYSYVEREETEDGKILQKCLLCGKIGNDRGNMRKHVENIHFPNSFQYSCKYCLETFGTRNMLNMHTSRMHRFQNT